ncbi:unnamed protein product [Cunninghamella blakesleeana]
MSKGVSFEEKRKRLLSLFHESCEVFQLKELEKLGPKKGIALQSVKEVVQSLIDDNLIMTEKIGISNYYWSFPSAAIQSKKNMIETIQKQLDQGQSTIDQLMNNINNEKIGREPSDERTILINQLNEVIEEQKQLSAQLKQYQNPDTILAQTKAKASKIAKDSANRWTENIWFIQSYCINKLHMDKNTFNQAFNIGDDFDSMD